MSGASRTFRAIRLLDLRDRAAQVAARQPRRDPDEGLQVLAVDLGLGCARADGRDGGQRNQGRRRRCGAHRQVAQRARVPREDPQVVQPVADADLVHDRARHGGLDGGVDVRGRDSP